MKFGPNALIGEVVFYGSLELLLVHLMTQFLGYSLLNTLCAMLLLFTFIVIEDYE